MQPYLKSLLLCCLFLATGLRGQQTLNRISPDIEDLGNGQVRVTFTPLQSLSGTGNPINIYLKIPQSQAAGVDINVVSSSLGVSKISTFGDPDGFNYYYFQGQPAVNLSSWQVGVPVTIATFSYTGSPNVILISGGDFGSAISTGGGGFFWPGTSIATDNTATNLIGWPISASVALPVEYTFFRAEAQGDHTSLLQWQTATEINNEVFEIQHSTNSIEFKAIGKVRGGGTTNELQDYKFIHRSPANGTNYYRLKQIDFDGAFEYSAIESVYFEGREEGPDIFQVFPNPSTSYLMIIPPEIGKTRWEVQVFDIQGKLMSNFQILESYYRLDTRAWPAGIYHLKVINDDRYDQIRFVKD